MKNSRRIETLVIEIIGVLVLFTFFGLLSVSMEKVETSSFEKNYIDNQALYAGKITDYYYDNHRPVRFSYVHNTILAVQKYRKIVFDNKTFSDLDLLALAMIESDFNPYAISHKNAVGVFQITHVDEYIKSSSGFKDPFDIYCNTRMGLEILRDKYNHHKDRKMAIIGYNGIVHDEDGNVRDNFYIKWLNARSILDSM